MQQIDSASIFALSTGLTGVIVPPPYRQDVAMSFAEDRPTSYPLAWPLGWPRATSRRRANFSSRGGNLTISDGLNRLDGELRRLGVLNWNYILSSNLVLGQRGNPLANQAEPQDPGVAVYFKLKGKPRVLACDRWNRTADNMAAIAAHIDAIRRVDRYGVGTLDQAFAGYTPLPPPGADNRPPWRKVLEVADPVTPDAVQAAYRAKARQFHPDLPGGSHEAMAMLNEARDAALRELAA